MSFKDFLKVLAVAALMLPVAGKSQDMPASPVTEPDVSVVYFCREITPQNILRLYEAMNVDLKGKVALKVHFGERGNENFLDPELLRPLADKVNPTFVETNVLYVSDRRFTDKHIALAKEHGFTFAPIDILDDKGEKSFSAEGMGLNHFASVKGGAALEDYDSYIIYSHFKGHGSAGFGGAIKNIGMGLASPGGKMAIHANATPKVNNPSQCFHCNRCVQQCPAVAISVDDHGPVIDTTKCIGCAKCIAECPKKLFSPDNSNYSETVFLEKLVEYTKVLTSVRPMVYINVMANISEVCDCAARAPKPFLADIGAVASTDIVAIDHACHDLVAAAQGQTEAFRAKNGVAALHQLEYAEKLNLGHNKYVLVDIETGERISIEQAVKQK